MKSEGNEERAALDQLSNKPIPIEIGSLVQSVAEREWKRDVRNTRNTRTKLKNRRGQFAWKALQTSSSGKNNVDLLFVDNKKEIRNHQKQ